MAGALVAELGNTNLMLKLNLNAIFCQNTKWLLETLQKQYLCKLTTIHQKYFWPFLTSYCSELDRGQAHIYNHFFSL